MSLEEINWRVLAEALDWFSIRGKEAPKTFSEAVHLIITESNKAVSR